MFVDASAFCAILLGEPDHFVMDQQIAAAETCRTSAIAVWETVRALVREQQTDVSAALEDVQAYLTNAGIQIVPIGPREQCLAVEAFDRFGKGRHPAALNMGDCFAYACARSLSEPLLYKGDDFSRTDIQSA